MAYPLNISLSESTEYNITVVESLSANYGLVPSATLVPSDTLVPSNGITISEEITESTEYNITVTTTGGS